MNAHTQALGPPVQNSQPLADVSVPRLTLHPPEASNSRRQLPCVLYVIDQICQLGGAERVLLESVKRMAPDRFRSCVVTFKIDKELEILKGLPCPLHVLPLYRTYNLHAAKMALRLRQLIQTENVSIVHTFFETSDLWAGAVAKLSGCPVLVSSRRDMGILRTRKHEVAYRLMNRFFDRVLAVSDEVRSYCLSHDKIPMQRVETLYNGIDLRLETKSPEARRRFGISEGTPVISTVANIRLVKGIDILIKATASVKEEFPNVIFLIAGGVLEPETFISLQRMVESLGLTKSVRFVGPLSDPYSVLRASDVFCLPSRSEGFSNALIEAMSCCLPCIATRVGGNAEAIEEGRNGFLVPSEDHEAMAERIILLLQNTVLARAIGENARQTVEARFTMQTMLTRLMDIYDELLRAKNV